MPLPIFQTASKDVSLLQTNWAKELNPLLRLPWNSGLILKSVELATGDNSIDTLLGRPLQGWIIVRSRAAATFYDKQDSNDMPSKTLVLNSSAVTTVDILVF